MLVQVIALDVIPGLRKGSLFRYPIKIFVTAQFLCLALGNLNINLQVSIGLVSHLPWLPSTLIGKVAVILGWQPY